MNARPRLALRFGTIAGLVLALATPTSVSAASWFFDDYDLLVTPRPDGTAHFTMRVVYTEMIGFKTDSFKQIGKHTPTNLVAHDDAGTALDVALSPDLRTPGWRVDFDLPRPPVGEGYESQAAVVEFDQALDASYAWGGPIFSVGWAPTFDGQLPAKTHYRVSSPAEASGYTCTRTDADASCAREMRRPEAFDFPLETRSVWSWTKDVGAVALGFVLGALLLGSTLRRIRATAIRERGVIAEEGVASEPDRQDGYRAPPPRPPPQLAAGDAKALRSSTLVVSIGLVTTFLPTLFLERCRAPVGVVSGTMVVIGAAFLTWYLEAKKGRFVLAAAPILVAVFLVAVGVRSAAVAAGALIMMYAAARTNLVITD